MEKMTENYLGFLSNHSDPIIRWKLSRIFPVNLFSPASIESLKGEIKSSPVVLSLLLDRNGDHVIPYHPYDKWFGSHWVLSILADLGYPEGDESLKPLLNQCYDWLLSKEHREHIKTIDGRVRRCASQEGNCVYYSVVLGLADSRTDELVERLLKWQWADGGWNCDKNPAANHSSFNETLIPLRGLAWYERKSGDPRVKQAVHNGAEVFLKRHLYKRIRDDQIIDRNFILLHYPNYWHYDYLFGLKVMAEIGLLSDPRCTDALDLLRSKQLADGGFPAEDRYYRVDDKKLSGHSRVDWGGTSKIHSNPYVSLDAYFVLNQSGRLLI